jgi:hypothetical protein
MNTISFNLSIPKDLYKSLIIFVTKAKSKNSNDFIIEAISQKLESEQLKYLLIEGYQSTSKEDLELTHEFETVDFENHDH